VAAWQAALNLYTSKAASVPVSLLNNIVWQNRSFFFDGSSGTAQLCSSNKFTDATSATHICNILPSSPTYACDATKTSYWDTGVVGDTSPANMYAYFPMTYSIVTHKAFYPISTNVESNPGLTSQYCNGGRTQFGQYWEPQQPFLPSPNLAVSATLDEAGNFVSLSYGPLTETNATSGGMYGDYHIGASSTATTYPKGIAGIPAYGFAPNHDYDTQARPIGGVYNIGADQYAGNGTGVVLTPAALQFGPQVVGTASATQSVTLTNHGTAALNLTAAPPTITSPFSIQAGTSTCTGSIAVGASCVIKVVFTPTANGVLTGTLTVAGQSVALSGSRTSGVTITPSSVDFGAVKLNGLSSPVVVTITNNTGVATTLNIPTIGAPFARTTTCTNNLAASARCTLTLTFAPGNTTAQQSASITIIDGNGQAAHRQVLSLTGHGATPQLYVTPVALNFGSVPSGSTGAPQTVTVTNTGTSAFTINSLTAPTANFAIAQGATCTAGLTLNAGDICALNVAFKPTANPTSQSSTLTINTTIGNQVVSLSGTRANGAISASPNQVIFGTVLFGKTSAPQPVTLTNTGAAAINPLTLGTLTNGFVHSACLNTLNAPVTSLAGHASCVVNLTYTPGNSTQNRVSVLSVNNNQLVTMSGNGAPVSLAPTSLSFAPQAIFTKSAPQTVTIANGTNAAIALNGLTFGGTNPDAFARATGGSCGATIAAHGTCTIHVTFTPTASDQQTATLSLSGQTVALSGSGKYLVVSPAALSFSATAGGSASQTVIVTNKGNTVVTGIAMANGNAAFTPTTNCINLTSGASCTVSVTFKAPATAGTTNDVLTITYDQVTNTPETVALTGVSN